MNSSPNIGAYSDRYKVVEKEQLESIKNARTKDTISRGKKLSQDNYRRRRALAIKKKLEAQREEKRRQQILAQRREKQREATERFQRRNRGYKRSGSVSPDRGQYQDEHLEDDMNDGATPGLDEALRVVRGSPLQRQGSADSQASTAHVRVFSPTTYSQHNVSPGYNTKSDKYAYYSPKQFQQARRNEHAQQVAAYTEMQARNLRNLNSSRNVFEQHLQQQQQLLVEQQEKSLHDFNAAIMQEMLNDKKLEGEENDNDDKIDTDSLSSEDSLEKPSGDITKKLSESIPPSQQTSEIDSFHFTHDELDFSNNVRVVTNNQKQGNGLANRDLQVEESSKTGRPGSYLVQSDILLVNNQSALSQNRVNKDSNVAVVDPDNDKENSQEQDPSVYRTSAFQIHNKAWISPGPEIIPQNNSNMLVSNSKPNSLKTTATNATATTSNIRHVDKYSNGGIGGSLGRSVGSHSAPLSSTSATTAANNTPSKTTVSQPSSTASVNPSSAQLTTSHISQLRQPTTYSHISAKGPVREVSAQNGQRVGDENFKQTNGVQFHVPNVDDHGDEESIQDDVSSINSTASNAKGPESETKVLKGILKYTPPVQSRRAGSKSGYGAMGPHRTVIQKPAVRDSIEINKKQIEIKHEKHQKKKSEKRKGVRFADLVYDDDSSSESGGDQPQETVYDIEKEFVSPVLNNTPQRIKDHSLQPTTRKPPRPISARVSRSAKVETRGPRASSAPVTRRNQLQQGRIIHHGAENGPPVRRDAFGENPRLNGASQVPVNNFDFKGPHTGYDDPSRHYEQKQPPGNEVDGRGFNGVGIRGQDIIEMNGVQLDRTPTDAEINWLWDKVRTCLNRDSSNMSSDQGYQSPSGRVYIDGNTLHPQHRHIARVASSPVNTSKTANHGVETLGSLKRRAALLHQRSQRQQPNTLKNFKNKDIALPQFTTTLQYPNSNALGPTRTLPGQTPENKPTVLSLEEQRLLQSLERLNERLRITEVSASPAQPISQPNVFSPKPTVQSGFKGHQPLSAHQRRPSDTKKNLQHFRTGSGSRTAYGRQY